MKHGMHVHTSAHLLLQKYQIQHSSAFRQTEFGFSQSVFILAQAVSFAIIAASHELCPRWAVRIPQCRIWHCIALTLRGCSQDTGYVGCHALASVLVNNAQCPGLPQEVQVQRCQGGSTACGEPGDYHRAILVTFAWSFTGGKCGIYIEL